MRDDEKVAGTTTCSPPSLITEIPAVRADARTSEVLRSLHRAKETIASTNALVGSSSAEPPITKWRAVRESSYENQLIEETAKQLAASARLLERAILSGERLVDFHFGRDGPVRELRECAQALMRQTDALAAWRYWWTKSVVAWGAVLTLLLATGAAFAWQAYVLAHDTHEVLAEILENQTKAQAVRSGKHK